MPGCAVSLLQSEIPSGCFIFLQLTFTGWAYLGGGDNGLGQNSGVRGVAADPCPPGSLKQMLNGDGVTNPGEDPNLLLSQYCVPCGPGVYCDESVNVTPQNCPAGTHGAVIGAKSSAGCIECPIGTYQSMDGQFDCQVCPVNTFASAPGATSCLSCGDGYEVSTTGSNICNACPAGKFRDSALSENCQECQAGTSSGEGKNQIYRLNQAYIRLSTLDCTGLSCMRMHMHSRVSRAGVQMLNSNQLKQLTAETSMPWGVACCTSMS